jgi:hypothetical protein
VSMPLSLAPSRVIIRAMMASIRRMPPTLLLAACLAAPAAHAAPPSGARLPPIRDGLDAATPLRTEIPAPPPVIEAPPETDGPPILPPAIVRPVPPSEVVTQRERNAFVVHGRWITVPGDVTGLFYDTYQTLNQPSLGLAFETGDTDERIWAIEAGWMPLVPTNGNWLSKNADPATADYVESNIHMLTLDLSLRRQFEIGGIFRAFIGAGLGIAVLVGDATTDDVLPDCKDPVEACGHWPTASRKTLDLPTRILPVLHLTVGLEIDLADEVSFRVSGGFKNVVYLGGAFSFNL